MARNRFAVMLALLVLAPSNLRAQETGESLSGILPDLYFDAVFGNLIALERLLPGSSVLVNVRNQLEPAFRVNDLAGAQLTSMPLATSGGGFTWAFDPSLSTFNRVSGSFGPFLAERALTVGKNRFNLGIGYQRATFDALENRDLGGGDIKIYTGSRLGARSVFIEDALDLELSSDTFGMFGTYGVTDRVDVGIAIPIVRVSMRARLDSRLGTEQGVTPDAFFSDERSGTASGIGDLVVRGKYNFWARSAGGVAAGVDWRVPTGDELNLLGAAGAQVKVYLTASTGHTRVSPHVNIGYTVSSQGAQAQDVTTTVLAPPNEVNYAGGVDIAATPRLTIAADLVGRNLRSFGQLVEVDTEFGSSFREFEFRPGSLNVVTGALGVKFNPRGNSLIGANLIFPLNDRGLRDNLMWTFSVEYSF